MTASLSNLSLTLAQSSQQRILRVVDLGYSYTLTNSVDPDAKDPGTVFQVEIDIIGDDVLSDDLLARAVDQHTVDCPAGASIETRRELTVAQGLLDEDVGDDEIKLTVRVQPTSSDTSKHQPANESEPQTPPKLKQHSVVEATTPIVKGKF